MKTEIKFGAEEDFLFQLLNPNICEFKEPNKPFTIEETNETGKAVIRIISTCPCFVVSCLDEKGNIRTLPFFNQTWKGVTTTCADHLLFLFDRDSATWFLHIFELKRSPNAEKWEHILNQFNGAMLRAYAIAGVLRIPDFAEIHLHCGYRKVTSNLFRLKQTSEKSKPREPKPESFLNETIILRSYPKLNPKNEPIKLDNFTGYAEIELHKGSQTIL